MQKSRRIMMDLTPEQHRMLDAARREESPDTATPGNPAVLLRLPAEVGIPLLRDSKKKKCTVQAVILEIVASHYGVTVEPPKRGGKKKSI